MRYAPIFILTLCRYEHFKKCVESLAKNSYAKDSELYIALDYPLKDSHWDGYNKILKYVDNIEGFESVIIIKREKNFGAILNSREGKKALFEKYDRIIVSEDDNEFSPNFLEYINKGLEKFENDKRIVGICGHCYLFKVPLDYSCNYYYLKGFSAWGYGMWRDRAKTFIYKPNQLKEVVKNKSLLKQIKLYYPRFYSGILSYIIRNKDMVGDGAIAIDMVKDNTYCLYPTISKVRNHGHDGSGIHCNGMKEDVFLKQNIDVNLDFSYSGNALFDDKSIFTAKEKSYPKENLKEKIKIVIKRLMLLLGISFKGELL